MNKPTLVALYLLAASTATQAATIAWSSQLYTVNGSSGESLDTGLFVTTGTQILAENVGGSALVFDGINFTAGSIAFAGGTYNGFHDNTNSPLSSTGIYGNNTPDTVTLTGLTIGAVYRIQALVYDGRGGFVGRTVEFDGTNMGQYANGTPNVNWGPGLLVTGNFTADATTQNFTIEAFNGTSSVGGQLNALLLHQVPEPSGLLLGGLGMLLGVMRRRR